MKMKLYLTMALAAAISWQSEVRADGLDDLTLDENGVVQISSATDFLNFANAVNEGNYGLNAILTQDVDLGTDEEGAETGIMSELTMVGGVLTDATDMAQSGSPVKYTGTFDGQYHKITYVKTKAEHPTWGLFGLLEEGGIIRNLQVEGTISTGKNWNAGLVSTINGGTVENCYVKVDITNGNTHGGIARVAKSGKGALIKGCVFAGSLAGTGGNSNGFMYGEDANDVAENCLLLSFGSEGSASYKFYRNKGTCINCYYLDTIETGLDNAGTAAVSAEVLKSGALCYILNGGVTDAPAWRQTLGEDDLPVLDPARKIVYTIGHYKCDGVTPTDGEDITYTNEGGSKVVEDHQFVNGACTQCLTIDPNYLVDGVFQIPTVGAFHSFALLVNAGNTKLDAQLTEDIDLGGAEDIPMVGFVGYSGFMVNTSGAYAGTFDGGYHTITYNKTADSSAWGLFGCLSGTIKNLKLTGSLTTEYPYMSALVNTLHGGTLCNCYCDVNIIDTASAGFHGGFARVTTGTGGLISGCWYAGDITGEGAAACAGIICFSERGTQITASLFTGKLNVDLSDGRTFVISRGTPTVTDCYYLQDTEASVSSGVAQITDEEIANGFACFALNAGNTLTPAWHQTIGSDAVPKLGSVGDVVYGFDNVFANIDDAASLRAFAQAIIDSEETFCEDRIAQTALMDSLIALSQKLIACPNIDSLLAYGEKYILPLKVRVLSSGAAYQSYEKTVDEALAYIEEHPEIQNVVRDELHDYLTDYIEPDETYAQGSAKFIIESHILSEQQLADEIAYINEMMEKMLSYNPTSGMEITLLFKNPDFEQGFEGWEGQLATGHGTIAPDMVHAVECWNSTMDMHQTLTGLKNGIYELQVNGAVSPYPRDDTYNTNYVAMLYLNGLQNYFQANIEDMVMLADTQDGVNCHISGANPDLEVFNNEDFEKEGYVMNRLESASIAFQAGRYPNSILVNVTDGSLTMGFRMPGSGNQPEWLGFGNIHVYYRGTLDEAGEALDNVLASQAARVNTILNDYKFTETGDSPNFSQALKDELQQALDAIETTTDADAKYQLIERFSNLFQEIYDCKLAYSSLLRQCDMLLDFYMALVNILDDNQLDEIISNYEMLSDAYTNGAMTAEEAKQNYLRTFSWMPEIVDGAYQIKTDIDFVLFATIVNSLDRSVNADLINDINLDQVIDQFQMVGGTPAGVYVSNGAYAGTFDGHGHTITYHKTATSDCWGLFGCLKGTVQNLRVSGTITTDFRYMATLVNTFDGGVVRNCVSDVDIITTSGNGYHGGIARVPLNDGNRRGGRIIDCVYAGTISGETAVNCGGICCWVEFGMEVTNCLFAGKLDINLAGNASYVIARNPSGASFTNCYYLNETGVVNPNTSQVTEEQMANGELRDMLNTNPDSPVWTQPEGSAYPVPFALATAIERVQSSSLKVQGSDAIYDLQGRRVENAVKGVYIINGKKVLK